MDRPIVKVARSGKKWGVKVKWPRSGPWTTLLLFPRFQWHGPFGFNNRRWDTREEAADFARSVEASIAKTISEEKIPLHLIPWRKVPA